MRLTADVLQRAEQHVNPLKERELRIRGYKIPAIENLAVLQDQFDAIDISDNEIKKLENFPKMPKLKMILIISNHISKISPNIGENLSNLTELILTNNRITSISEIDNIATLKKIQHLSLLDNPVTFSIPQYRLYVIHKIPSLKTLDFRKISLEERSASKEFFESASGKSIIVSVAEEIRLVSSGDSSAPVGSKVLVLTEDQKRQVREAIQGATTKEDIDRIERQLKTGSFVFIAATVPVPAEGSEEI